MRQLRTPDEAAGWLRGRVRGGLHCDSRRVRPGDGFIAWPGAATDGRRHVPSALAQGAAACLVELEGSDTFGFADEAIAGYSQLKAATGPIAAAYYEHPTRQLEVLAVTGTNGKTSTAWWLAQALSNLPQGAWPCAVVGTLGTGRPPQVEFNGLTTPDPVLLQAAFRRFADDGLKACAIEASSIGLAERRLDGTNIAVALFTNFTQDHLDYHGSMEAYWDAKAQLFRWPGLRAAVVNVDDAKGVALVAALQSSGLDLWPVSCEHDARLSATGVGYGDGGLRFTVVEGGERHELTTGLVGQFNVANLLGVVGGMRALGVPLADAVRA
ncbi:MAG: UDP-N-acetylmuramoyl-L-alanyl-D-glutamate--2,6-diaminopimelate ligase, partial [Comamonadaceae bacterium]